MSRQDQETSPEERIKELVEFEEEKRKEIEDKKAELEAKKKEIEELEKAGVEEIEDARDELAKKIEELAIKQRRLYIEQEEKRKALEKEIEEKKNQKPKPKPKSLEESVAQEPKRDIPKAQMRGYNDAIESIMTGKANFYDITNYNVVNRLDSIAASASSRPLTKSEKDFVSMVEYHAKGLAEEYQGSGSATYVAKELAQIDFINKVARKTNQGDYSQ